MSVKISAYVLTHNNERTVEAALKSLQFVDEIVVVDSYSTDGTVEIAKRYTERVIQRSWPGFRDQYQFAHDQCRHEWAVFIDADEEVSEELAQEMRESLQMNAALPEDRQAHGFYAQRRTFYLDRWILHGGWVPDREIRLYRRTLGSWKGDLHAKVQVAGTIGYLKRYYYHYSYENIEEQLEKMNSYSSTAADDMERAGDKFSMFRLFGNPMFRFFREFVLKRGFLDGLPGFIIAVNNCFYVFNKYAKLWEQQHCKPELVESKKYNHRP